MPKRSKLSRRARRKALSKGQEEGKALLSPSQQQKLPQELDEDYEDIEETTEQSPAPPRIEVQGASPTSAFAQEETESPENPSSAKAASEPKLQEEETSGHRVHFANNHQQTQEEDRAASPSEGTSALRRGSTSFHRSRQTGKSLDIKDISTPRTPKGTTVDTIVDLNLQIEGLIPIDAFSALTPPSPNNGQQEKNVVEELSTSTSPRVESGLQVSAPQASHSDLRLQMPEEELTEAHHPSVKETQSTSDRLVTALDNKSQETISAVQGVIGDKVKPAIDNLSSRFGIFQQKLDENLHLKALVIYFIIACDALSFTVLEPVLPLMIESRMGIHETVVGNYVGLVIGAFSAAQFLTTPFYGYLSDTLGRKVFVVISLFTSMICLASLGFVTNVYMAILIRFVQGFFNSANALSKAYLIDISSAENRTTLLAYLGAAQALSRSITAGFGGLSIGLLTYLGVENPYLLPCLVGSLLIGVSLYLSFNLSEQPKERADSAQRPAFWAGVKEALSERTRAVTIFLFALSHFGNGASLMLLVLLCEESIKNYGFGLQNWQTGFLFMLYGLGGFAFQVLIFKKMVQHGLRMTYFIGSVLSAVQIIMLPFVGIPYWLNNNEWSPRASLMVWALLVIDISIASVAKMVLIPILQIIMANATEPEKQGIVQGVSMSLGVLFKAIGPAVCGALFTISINRDQPYLVFLFTGFVYFVCSFVILLVPASLEHPKERGIQLVEDRVETIGGEQGISAVEPPTTTLPYKAEGEGVSLKLQTLEA